MATNVFRMALGVFSFVAAVWYLLLPFGRSSIALEPQWDQSRSWAQYSPWFAPEPYQNPPNGCDIVQVNILQRHGARFPTKGAGKNIKAALKKLQSVQTYTDPRFAFLSNFTYDLGHDDLVPFGAQQSLEAGRVAFERYSRLVTDDNLPFLRASSSERVVLSATNWTVGFSVASHHKFNPVLSVILSEALNDTLDDAMCPNAGSSDPQTNQWQDVYAPPITARLNKAAVGANLTSSDTQNIMSLCPFYTVAKEQPSPFCDWFTPAEFGAFEYSGDLNKYYGTGYGQELGPVQGVGYINELLARLTGQPVQDNTQTNRTLDASPETFPLNRTIYADFSHDNQMIAIYSAMGLFPQAQPLNPTKPDRNRNWLASRLVPFSSRMVVEKLACEGEDEEYIRILVNDVLQPLQFCGATKDGLCRLDDFVQSQAYARNDGNGDFEKCFTS